MSHYYTPYITRLHEVMKTVEATSSAGGRVGIEEALRQLCETSREVSKNGSTQYFCGNGASCAFSNHMALDWTKNGGVRSQSFSNSALLTALGNDLGYEDVFSSSLDWYAHSGDLLIAISSSGNSANVVRAIKSAREKGLRVFTFTGLQPNNICRQLGDINLYIPAKTYGMVECAHQILLHVWLDKYMGVRDWNRDSFQNMRHDNFSI